MNNDNNIFLNHVTLEFDQVYKQFKLTNEFEVINITMPCRSSVQAISEACIKMEISIRKEIRDIKREDRILANMFKMSEAQILISQDLESEVVKAEDIDYDSLCNFAENMPDKQVSGRKIPRKV